MITKTVDWLGIKVVVEYTVSEFTVAYQSIRLVDPSQLGLMLEHMLLASACPEHTFHVVPALADLAEVLDPTPAVDPPAIIHSAPRSTH